MYGEKTKYWKKEILTFLGNLRQRVRKIGENLYDDDW
jgi:hypothetical protein